MADQIHAQVEHWAAPYLSEGWLHINSVVSTDVDNQSILPNGAAIPDEYVTDDWYLLDKSGSVLEAVSIMSDTSGKVIQQTVLKDSEWINLTLNDRSPAFLPFSPQLDSGFAQISDSLYQSLEQTSGTLNNRPVNICSVREVHTNLANIAGYDQPAKATAVRGYFDAENSSFMRMDTIISLADGSERVNSSGQIETIESVSVLPDAIAKILDQVGSK
jgi:hypothetical protein